MNSIWAEKHHNQTTIAGGRVCDYRPLPTCVPLIDKKNSLQNAFSYLNEHHILSCLVLMLVLSLGLAGLRAFWLHVEIVL